MGKTMGDDDQRRHDADMRRVARALQRLREQTEAEGIYHREDDGTLIERPELTLIRGGGEA
jgi:hypothetical protein